MFGVEAREDAFDEGELAVGGAVFDKDEGLASWVNAGAVKGVAGYDGNVRGQVLFEGGNFGGFA